MNLHVDLLLDTERRSGSQVRATFLARIATIAVPTILGIVLISVIFQFARGRRNYKSAQNYIKDTTAAHEKLKKLRGERNRNEATLTELELLHTSRLNWHEQLDAFRRVVHPEVQIKELRMFQKLVVMAGSKPRRIYTMIVRGTASGKNATEIVGTLKDQLENSPVFKPVVNKAKVTRFEQPVIGSSEREFEIECQFHARKI